MSTIDFDQMADAINRNLKFAEPVTDALLDRLPPTTEKSSVLDIACGAGEPGLTILRRSDGVRLRGIDSSSAMIEMARRNAANEELSGARFDVMNYDQLELEDASIDLVVSRFGLLSFGDPVPGANEAVRVLRPGGSLGVAAWDSLNKNILIYAAVTALGSTPSALKSTLDDLERFAMPKRRERWLRNAGLSVVDSELFDWTAEFPNEQAMWDFAFNFGPTQQAAAALDDDQRADVRKRFEELLVDYRRPDASYALPYACQLIWGRR